MRSSLEKYGLRSALSGFARRSRRRATGSVGSSGRRSRAHLAKIPFCASLAMCRKDAEDGWGHTSEVRRARKEKANGARSGNCACSPRSRRVMLGSFSPRAGPSSSSCARLWTPWASLASTVASVWIKLRRARRTADRAAPGSSWRLLTQSEQPRSSPSFQGTARAEPATARRAKLTPRWELAMACMGRRRVPEARLLPRRQSDGGIVGFTSTSRQRALPSRSTRPRFANRPSRIETALLSQRVVFAHCTTPASGSSRIASSSARSRAADSPTPGLKPGGRLE